MKKYNKESGSLLGHTFCLDCGSSDALAVYQKTQSVDGHCYSFCEASGKSYKKHITEEQLAEIKCEHLYLEPTSDKGSNDIIEEDEEEDDYMALPKLEELLEDYGNYPKAYRKIKAEVTALYGMKYSTDAQGNPDGVYFPCYQEVRGTPTVVGYKPKTRFKATDPQVISGKATEGALKCFSGSIGYCKKDVMLYGQNLWSKAPKHVIITEGQEDAMAAYQMVAEHKIKGESHSSLKDLMTHWGSVSIQQGTGSADAQIKANMEWFNSAEYIFLCFDNDDAGRLAEEKVRSLFKPSKLRVCSGTLKDANDYLKANKGSDFWYDIIWKAEQYCPTDIVNYSKIAKALKEKGATETFPLPCFMGDSNERLLGGLGFGEITTILAASGIGKSSVVNGVIKSFLDTTTYNTAVISLEADQTEFAVQLDSLYLGKRLIEEDPENWEWDKIEEIHHKLDSRLYVVEKLAGINNEKAFWDKIDFMVKGLDCRTIVFDPATLGVRACRMDEDEFLADLVTYVKDNGLCWINVVHARKSDNGGKSNSQGKELSEEDAKGSGAWFQNSANFLILERNKLHENAEVKNTTRGKWSKIRRNGNGTGVFGFMYYNPDNGMLEIGRSTSEIMEGEVED